ncbi:hypothetical protein ACWEFJ_04250 [Actinosynnema sp. NPDC004786]
MDPGPVAVNLAFNRFVCDRVVPHPVVGRQLARLAADAWLTDLRMGPFLASFTLFRVTVTAA